MKNIIIGIILGFVLTLPFTVRAYNVTERDYLEEILYVLEDMRDNGEDIYSRMDTILDRI